MNLLRCKDLVFGYAKRKGGATGFASPFDFGLDEGEVVALMGENGCGKSTLLKTLSGMIPPLSGEVVLLGTPDWNSRERAKQVALVRMGQMGADSFDRMTVREFVGLGRTPYAGLFDGHSAEDERAVDESLELLELKNFAGRWMSELSDGERSRAYLAMAVAQRVRVLLLDEPNAFLDIPHSKKLFALLRDLAKERGMGILVSTHSVEYAEKYSDRLMVIADGRVKVARTAEARSGGLLDWTEV
jgi:iron complex transport system ATP-binding protein